MGGAISCALRVAQKARGRPFGVAGLALLGLMGLRGPSKDPARERALDLLVVDVAKVPARPRERALCVEQAMCRMRASDPWEQRSQGRSHEDLIRRGFPKRRAFECA